MNKRGSSALVKYVLQFVITLFLLSLFVFYMSRLAPGNPLRAYYGESVQRMSQKEQDAAIKRLGLKEPIYLQYGKWLKEAVKGNFGISYKYKRDTISVLKSVVPNTLLLGGISYLLVFILALVLGIFCAGNEDHLTDRMLCRFGTVIGSIPSFWVSMVLIFLFSIQLKILPSSGAYSIGKEYDFKDRVIHLVLPVVVLVLSHLSYYTYIVRNKLLEEVRKDYVLLCRSRGLNKKKILYQHCVKNILPFYVSLAAASLPHILSGTYIVEKVFSYPGLGTICFESAKYHDYNLLMVASVFTGAVIIAVNMAAQAFMVWINPSMKKEAEVFHCD